MLWMTAVKIIYIRQSIRGQSQIRIIRRTIEIIGDDESGTLRKAILGNKWTAKAPPLRWGAFFNLFGYIGGRDAERRAAGGDGTDAGAGEIAAREIKMGPLRESGGALLCKEGWNCR